MYFFNVSKYFLLCLIAIPVLSICQDKPFPYKLSYSKDIPLGIATLSSVIATNLIHKNHTPHYLTNYEIENLDPKSVNKFDRSATNNWNPRLDKASTITKNILCFSPLLIALHEIENENWRNLLTLGVIYLEGNLVNENITSTTKILCERKRPYFYNKTTISPVLKNALTAEGNRYSYESFFSGHTSTAFYSAVFISKTFTDMYGKSAWSYIVWGTTLTLATTTGYFRYKSGWHYPTDIIVGAFVGSITGYLIPQMHKTSKFKNTTLSISNNSAVVIHSF